MPRAKAKPIDMDALRRAATGDAGVPASPPPTLDEVASDWKVWLRALHGSLWQTHRNTFSRNPIERDGWSSEARRLTPEEWGAVQGVLRGHEAEVICELHNACMGFGCGLAVYEVPPLVYPGADVKPEFLIDVTKEHLPLTVCDLREPGEHGANLKDRTLFSDGWRAFSPFSHSGANAKLLAEHGFEPPKDKGHYDY